MLTPGFQKHDHSEHNGYFIICTWFGFPGPLRRVGQAPKSLAPVPTQWSMWLWSWSQAATSRTAVMTKYMPAWAPPGFSV